VGSAVVRRRRAVEVVRAGLGVWHLGRSLGPDDRHRALDRVLGVRQLAQSALVLRAGTAEAHTLSAVVDALHGATMVPLALDPARRRFATGQSWIALALTIAEVVAVGAGNRRVGGRR
jgi:hypothetical protein